MSQIENIINQAKPLSVALSATTDWPTVIVTGAIGIGSILTSIGVARISKMNQQTQNRAKIAELRQKWIENLREEISKFCSTVFILTAKYRINDEFHLSSDCSDLYRDLYTHRATILLMLDRNKDSTLVIKSLINDICSDLSSKDVEKIKETKIYLMALQEQSQTILENAWLDIKNDLFN